jgi:hypothetical protein
LLLSRSGSTCVELPRSAPRISCRKGYSVRVLDAHSPNRQPGIILYRALVFQCFPLVYDFTFAPESTHNSKRAGPLPVAFIEASLTQAVHYYSPLLHQRLSTPALQSRTCSRYPHKTHPKRIFRTPRCRTQTPTTRLRPITPRPSRHPRQ